MPVLTVCQGASCGGNGATFAIRDIEDLSFGLANVEVTGCLGHCQKGPNCSVSETSGAKGKVTNKLNKFSKITEMLGNAIPGFALSDVQKKVSKLKYNARRDDNAAERKKMIDEALALCTDDVKALHPELYAQTLTLRARENMKADPVSAYSDMKQVMALVPDWAFGCVTMSTVMSSVNMPKGALEMMQKAMKIKNGVDPNTLKRAITRLERQAGEAEGDDVEPEGVAAPAAAAASSGDGAAASGAKPKAKSKAKAKAKSKSDSAKKSGEKSSSKAKEKAKEEAAAPVEPPDEQEWELKAVRYDNHDCMRMELSCTGPAYATFNDPIWHVDLIAEMGDVGEEVKRSYTPASGIADMQKGMLDLMVKVYPKGKMTQYLSKMKVGDKIVVTKPIKTEEPSKYTEGLIMVAGGSAVTVALQVCEAVLATAKGEVHLFLCNRTAADVLFTDRLEKMLEANSSFKVTHCLSQGDPPESAAGQKATWQKGKLSFDNLAALPKNLKAVLSGPGPLCRSAYDHLMKLERQEDMIDCLDPLPEAAPEPEAPAAPTPQEAPAEVKMEDVKLQEPQVEQAANGGFFSFLFPFAMCKCSAPASKDDEDKSEVAQAR
eukprot:TRINITY_DN1882_c1_g1_i1.p1 TRINITY_DN1882_c1_g1~~TRINITY_DN1882_c1_g1_i1.p1  ORF type:complete len:604 (-),score=173.46 TRINITY_DN1882_c1_g1_i1:112-1923(-)